MYRKRRIPYLLVAKWLLVLLYQDRQLRHVQTYDPLTHIPRVQEPPPKPRYTRTTDTKVQYNILSNLDFTQHHWAPPEKRYALGIALKCSNH